MLCQRRGASTPVSSYWGPSSLPAPYESQCVVPDFFTIGGDTTLLLLRPLFLGVYSGLACLAGRYSRPPAKNTVVKPDRFKASHQINFFVLNGLSFGMSLAL